MVEYRISILAKACKDAFCLSGVAVVDDHKALHDGHLSAWLLLGFASEAIEEANAHGHSVEKKREDVAGDSVDDQASSPYSFVDGFDEEDGKNNAGQSSLSL